MLLNLIFTVMTASWSAPLAPVAVDVTQPIQGQIDRAFELILGTSVGRSICSGILGSDPSALQFHLGISAEAASKLAPRCGSPSSHRWIYPTDSADIRKLTLRTSQPRHYKIVQSPITFPIESWTDSFSNTTAIVVYEPEIEFQRLVLILTHEMAVYFDSKTYPALSGAREIPALANLQLSNNSQIDPLVAVSDPMIAHTMTYLRALQIEFAIMDELVANARILPTKDYYDSRLRYLISPSCAHACIEEFVRRQREDFRPFSLPLLAFAPHYRALINTQLPQLQTLWQPDQWAKAQQALNTLPEQFLKGFTGDVISTLQRVYYESEEFSPPYNLVADFFAEDLWPIEDPAIFSSRIPGRLGPSFLEFMKEPLISGYNIWLSSGPRVRVRGGLTE